MQYIQDVLNEHGSILMEIVLGIPDKTESISPPTMPEKEDGVVLEERASIDTYSSFLQQRQNVDGSGD